MSAVCDIMFLCFLRHRWVHHWKWRLWDVLHQLRGELRLQLPCWICPDAWSEKLHWSEALTSIVLWKFISCLVSAQLCYTILLTALQRKPGLWNQIVCVRISMTSCKNCLVNNTLTVKPGLLWAFDPALCTLPAPILFLTGGSASLFSILRYWWVWGEPRRLWWRPVYQHPRDIPVSMLWWFHVIWGYEDLPG